MPRALQGSLPLTVVFPRNGLTLRPTVQSDSMYFNSFFLSCMTSPRFWKSLSSPPRPTPPHQPRYRAAFTAKYKVNSTHHHSHSAATAKGSVPSAVPGLEDEDRTAVPYTVLGSGPHIRFPDSLRWFTDTPDKPKKESLPNSFSSPRNKGIKIPSSGNP